MATKVMPKAITEADSDLARLGDGAYVWEVSPTHVDLSKPPATAVLATISAEPQNDTIDLKRSAMIVSICNMIFAHHAGAGANPAPPAPTSGTPHDRGSNHVAKLG
jgi:hypothetical protein